MKNKTKTFVKILVSFGMLFASMQTQAEMMSEPKKFILSVENGAGSGIYEVGETITISATYFSVHNKFREWIIPDGVLIIDKFAETTSITMPNHDVTISARHDYDQAFTNVIYHPNNDIEFDEINDAVYYAVRLYDENNVNLTNVSLIVPAKKEGNRVIINPQRAVVVSGQIGTHNYKFEIVALDSARAYVVKPYMTVFRSFTSTQNQKPTHLNWDNLIARWDKVETADAYDTRLYKYVAGVAKEISFANPNQPAYNWTNKITETGNGIYFFTVRSLENASLLLFASEYEESIHHVVGTEVSDITVMDGDGGGKYQIGDTITIKAHIKPNYVFTHWSSATDVSFDNPSASTTQFVANAKTLEIVANYQAVLPKEEVDLQVDPTKLTFFYDGTPKQLEVFVQDDKLDSSELEFEYLGDYKGPDHPINAGIYSVKYSVPLDHPSYQGYKVFTFEIEKIQPSISFPPHFNVLEGSYLFDIQLDPGYEWTETENVHFTTGNITHTFSMRYTSEDTLNYLTVEKEVDVFVEAKVKEPEAYDYRILAFVNQNWTKGSQDDIVITINGDFNLFDEIRIDGAVLNPQHYQVKEGSVIIKLFANYLESLSVKNHDISVKFGDMEVKGTFSVFAKNDETKDPQKPSTPIEKEKPKVDKKIDNSDKLPQTGDINVIVYVSMMSIFIGLWIKFKYKEEN